MKIDLFGEIRVREGYDPDDEPGPFGVSFNELKKWVDCDPERGIAWRIKDCWTGRYHKQLIAKAGNLLPSPSTCIDGHNFKTHHIIWVFHTGGIWAEGELDHKDGNNLNNKVANLREATSSQQKMNHGLRGENTSGTSGVNWHLQVLKWQARIWRDRKTISLGCFDNYEDAVAARKAAEKEYYGEYSRDTSRGPFKYNGPQLF